MNILQDFKERFLNFETVKGIYLLPAGGVICYVTLFYLQYVIQGVLSGARRLHDGGGVSAQSALRADSKRGSSGSFSTAPYQG